jgi:hypothetical protein
MKKLFPIMAILFFMSEGHSQDERYFRELFLGRPLFPKKIERPSVKWRSNSPFYQIDLDGKYGKESFVLEKRDGEDWLLIFNLHKERVFEKKLETLGRGSKVYRMNIRDLSKKTKLIAIHFYQGHTEYLNFKGTAKMYFLTIDNQDLSTLSLNSGPTFWVEKEIRNGYFHRRFYHFSLFDYDEDGIKEVAIKHHLITHLFKYKGKGKWVAY